MFIANEHMKIMNIYMVVIVLAVSTSVCGTDSMGSNPINHPKLEDCQSGLLCNFAKVVDFTVPKVRILHLPQKMKLF